MRTVAIFFILIILFAIKSCRKDNVDAKEYDANNIYVPYQESSYFEYRVDSLIYDDFNDTIFTTTTYRREYIEELDNTIVGRKLFRVLIYQSKDSATNWTFLQADQWALTEKYFERQIDNVRFTVLSFPSNLESIWDINLYNTLSPAMRYYTGINDTFALGDSVNYGVLKIENEPKVNSVVDRQTQEVFAKNIGLISKKIINIETQFGKKRGFSVLYTLYDYKI